MCTIPHPHPHPTTRSKLNNSKGKTAAYNKHWVTFLESMKLSSLNKDYAHFRLSLLSFRSLSFGFSVSKVGNMIKALERKTSHFIQTHIHGRPYTGNVLGKEWMNQQTQFLHSILCVCECVCLFVCRQGLRLWPVGKWRPRTPQWLDQRRSPPVWWTGCTFWRVSWRAGPLPWRRSSLSGQTDRQTDKRERVNVD